MTLTEKLFNIQCEASPLIKDAKLQGEDIATWTSDEYVRNMLRPLFQKYRVLFRLISSKVREIGEARLVESIYEYINVDDPCDTMTTSVCYEIGKTDLTGVGITLCGKYANINTFFLGTNHDGTGSKPLGLVASPAEKALEKIEAKKTITVSINEFVPNDEDAWKKEFAKVKKLGINIDKAHELRLFNFDYKEVYKEHGVKASQAEKFSLVTAVRLGIENDYILHKFPDFVYEPRVPSHQLFSKFHYTIAGYGEIKGYIPTANERSINFICDHFLKYITDILKVDIKELGKFITNGVNAGDFENLAWDENWNAQDPVYYLRVASPKQIEHILINFIAKVL